MSTDPTPQTPLTVSLRIDASTESLKQLCDKLAAAVKPDGGYAAATTDDLTPTPSCCYQVVGVECWIPQHGCDSLENTLDAIKGRILAAVTDWYKTSITSDTVTPTPPQQMTTDPTPQVTPSAATSEIIVTGLLGSLRHTTGPHAWRLARKNGELILQGLMMWRDDISKDGGEYWETFPTIDLTDEESES